MDPDEQRNRMAELIASQQGQMASLPQAQAATAAQGAPPPPNTDPGMRGGGWRGHRGYNGGMGGNPPPGGQPRMGMFGGGGAGPNGILENLDPETQARIRETQAAGGSNEPTGGTPEEMQAKQASMRERMGDMKMRQGVFGGGQQPPVLGQPQGMPPGTPKGGSAMPPGATVADGAGQNNFGPGVDNYAPPPGGAPPANGGKMGGSSVAGGASDPNMPPPSPGGGGYAPKGAQSSFAGGLA